MSLPLLPSADARAADADDAAAPPPAPAWLADLPAVSTDGSIVAVANHQSLGGRGDERLLLDFIDVAGDRLVRRIIVSDPDHPESRAGGEARARAVLAAGTWVKLREHAPGDGLDVQYQEPALVVRDTTSSADLVRKNERSWSHPAGRPCPTCETCPAPLASLEGAWGDRLYGVLLVQLSFSGGSDICWEPPDDFHVVEIPATIAHP